MQQREINIKDYKYFTDLRKRGNNACKDLVQGMVPYKSLTLVYGGPKSCKSLIELCKCMSLSRGIKFLGKFKTTKTNCLYIDLENSERIIDERELALKKLLKKRKHKVYFITRENRVNLLDKQFQEELRAIIKEKDIGYIAVDTLPKAAPYDYKEERDVNNLFLSFFKPFIDEFNLSICFILHTTKKGNSFLGSQAYLGISDCCFEFKKSYEYENTVKTEIHSDNRGNNISLGVKLTFGLIEDKEGYLHLKDIGIDYYDIEERRAGSKAAAKHPSLQNKQTTQDIISLFKENTELQKSEIIQGLKDKGYDSSKLSSLDSSIKRILSWLSSEHGKGAGIMIRKGEGKGTRYKLSDKGVNMLKNKMINQNLDV